MKDYLQEIEERLESMVGMTIQYDPKEIETVMILQRQQKDIQNLLKLVRRYERENNKEFNEQCKLEIWGNDKQSHGTNEGL